MENNQEENTENILNENVPENEDIIEDSKIQETEENVSDDIADSVSDNIETDFQSGEEKLTEENKEVSDKETLTEEISEKSAANEVVSKSLAEEIPINEANKEAPPKEISEETETQDKSDETDTGFVQFADETESNNADELVTVRPVKFKEFEPMPPNRTIKKNYDIMQDITMHVSVELGRTKSSIKEVIELKEGSIVELDKIAGEQVEIYVNDRLVAKGEVIVIEDRFGVRVTSTNLQKSTASL